MAINWVLINCNLVTNQTSQLICAPGWQLRQSISLQEMVQMYTFVQWICRKPSIRIDISKGLPEIYLRLLILMYRGQSANVRWNNTFSKQFPLSNGVKQGAVLSAILFCIYLNDLYKILCMRRSGCWVNGDFNGICGYSDDILRPYIICFHIPVNSPIYYLLPHSGQFAHI